MTSSELQRVPYPVGDPAKMGQTLSGTVTMGITLDPKAVANAAAAAEALGAPAVGVKFKLVANFSLAKFEMVDIDHGNNLPRICQVQMYSCQGHN